MAELAQSSRPNQRSPDQSPAPDEQASAPSTGESRQDIRRRLGREARPTEQAVPQTTTATDPRAEQVAKLQESFQRDAVHGSSPDQRDRLSASLKTSQELLAQYQQVNEQIKTLGPNADPATLQDLQARADLLIKQSAATLLHANTERVVAGIEQRQEQLSQTSKKLGEEIKELEKLDERDPRRLAGILEVKRDQLQALEETKAALETMKASLSSSLVTSDSFLKRAAELSKEQPISAAHLADANANIDSGLLVLEDADRKTSLQAIDTGLQRLDEAQRFEIERREAFAENIARYDQQDLRLREACKVSGDRAQSTINQALRATGDITQAISSWNPFQGFASWVTGTTSAMETSRDNLLSTADEQNAATGQLLHERASVLRSREEFIKWTRSGFEAEKQGDLQKAQALFNQAALINQSTADLGNPASISQTLTQPSTNWQRRNREVTKELDAAVASANNWETGLEVARNVTVVAGATVATVATAGAGAGIFLSFAAGSGGGIAIGSLSNTTEQVTSVATGLKTREEAQEDFKIRFTQDALTSLETAATTATGLGAGRLFQSSSLASRLSTTVARPLTGAIGGGSSGAATTAIDTARTLYKRNEAIAEFNRSPEAQGLSPDARQAALDARLSELGLGLDDLARRGIVNFGVGAVGGAIGANTGAAREAAKTNLGKFSTVVLDTGADLTLGLSATLLTDGKISFEQGLAQSLQSVFVGNALSSLPARRTGAAETSAQPAKTKVNYLEGAESLRARFVSDSIDQLTTINGRPPTPEEVSRVNAESKLVRAYENPRTGEINVLKIDTDSMSHAERVCYASDIVHELAHRRGGDEAIAHKAQFEYLLKNGYQPELVDGQLRIRALEPGEAGALPTDKQIKDYVSRNYDSEESLGGMRLSKDEEGRRTDSETAQPPNSTPTTSHPDGASQENTTRPDQTSTRVDSLNPDPPQGASTTPRTSTRITGLVPEDVVPLRTFPEGHPRAPLNRKEIPRDIDPARVIVADPSSIRTSQTGVDGESTAVLAQKMKDEGFVHRNEKQGPLGNAVDLVMMPDGGATSIDNRRIVAAEEAGIPVVAIKREYNEPLTGGESKRFQKNAAHVKDPSVRQKLIDSGNYEIKITENGQQILRPRTWGAAVELRVATNEEAEFTRKKPFGSISERPVRRQGEE